MEDFYGKFNQLKKDLWAINEKDKIEPITKAVKDLLLEAKNTLSENAYSKFKENIVNQYQDSLKKKTDFLEKKKSFPVKQNYIFREDEGKAFINLCNSLSRLIEQKLNNIGGSQT